MQCQNDRSQHRNRSTAMDMLKSKLYELQIAKDEEENKKLGQKKVKLVGEIKFVLT